MKYFILITFWALIAQAVDEDIYSHFGNRSPYRFNANTNVTVDEELQKCTSKIWGLVRHGSRYPITVEINAMLGRLPAIRDLIVDAHSDGNGPLSDEVIAELKVWVAEVTSVDDLLLLVEEGELENYELAQRMQQRYPYTLPNIYDSKLYTSEYTEAQRNEESAKYFAIGLFGEENIDGAYTQRSVQDTLLLFYHQCSKWSSEISRNQSLVEEQSLFEGSIYVSEMVERVNEAVGLTNDLSFSDIQSMYKLCIYEIAWHRDTTSPWCELFTVDDAKVLEYHEDLDYYWYSGYGYELNYKQACPLMQDIVSFFDDDSEQQALLYFSHGETLMKFLAHLGLYKDDVDLLHDNYESMDDRLWRVGKLGSFASNIMFVLHECDGEKSVSVLHNEHVVRLPACPDNDICSYETLKEYFEESINCDLEEMCDGLNESGGWGPPGGPDEPGQPDDPNPPDEPNQTDEPVQPDEPSQTDEPDQPDEPNQTEEPDQTDDENNSSPNLVRTSNLSFTIAFVHIAIYVIHKLHLIYI